MKKNLQISIEMLSVYSLVLLMFTILLASISTQASVAISQQLYLQLLANAQDFASRIQRAYSYGNGYKESFYFPAEVGFIPFNLTITGPGIITASAKYGNKVLSAYAFSGVQNYYLDPYYAIPNGYSIPIAAGIINIVNSNGLICINSQTCPAYKIPKYISIYATNSTASTSNNVTIVAKVTDQFGNPIPYPWVGFSTTLGVFSNNKQTQFVQGDGMGIAKVTLKSNNQKGIAKVTATAFNGNSSIVSNLAAWFPLNENQQNVTFDVKNNNNGNAYNIAWLSATPISSASFNGVNAYIGIPANPNITTAITISAWVTITQLPFPNWDKIVDERNSSLIDFALGGYNGYTGLDFGVNIGGTWTPLRVVVSWLKTNTFYHIVGTWNGSVEKIYVNGQLVGSQNAAGTIKLAYQRQRFIGRSVAGEYWNGSIANVQIYSTALTPQQIQQLYSQGINSPPIPNAGLVGWWPLQGNANDYSSYNNNGIIYNAIFVPINVTQLSNLNVSSSPIINQFPIVGKFNGVNSYIEVPNSQSLSISGNQITMEAWIYPTSYPTEGIIFNKENTYEWAITSSGTIKWAIRNTNPGWVWVDTGLKAPLKTWTHFVITYDGTKVVTYKNGGLQTHTYPANGNIQPNTNALRIGARGAPGSPGSFFNGSIANVQIYSTALTPQQIQQLYLQGINSPPIPNAGLVGWWPLQGNANDYSSYGNNGTISNVGFVRSNYSYLPIYQSSNKSGATFNGVNTYIDVPHSSGFDVTQLTIALWIKTPTNMGQTWRNLVSKQGADRDYNFYAKSDGYPWNGEPRVTALHFSSARFGSSAFSLPTPYDPQTWHFVAITVNANGLQTYYSDGKPFATYQGTSGNANNNYPVWIGRADNYWNGVITNVQIYNSSLTSQQIQQLYYAGIPPLNEIRIVLK